MGLTKTKNRRAAEQLFAACYVLTVDYREGWVRMEPPQKLSAPGPQLGDNAKLPVPLAFR